MKKKIENFFKMNTGTAFKSKEIAKLLNLMDPPEYAQLKSILHKLFKEDFLLRKGKRFQINHYPESSKLQGTLQNHPNGYGFVIPKKKKLGDIFISERNIGPAFDGDTVEVVLFAKTKGKNLEGQIIKVIERKRKEILGTLHKSNSFYFIAPDDYYLQRDIYIDKANIKGAKEGDKVIVGDIEWNTSMLNPEGTVLEVLGREGSADVELTAIARQYKLKTNFPAKVLRETEAIKFKITDEEAKKRLDLRADIIFTIDPADAKDYDDALSIKLLENGNFNLGVHIADVSHFVAKDSPIDNQARLRGNSVYLVGKVIPMLPEKISNGVCSLVPFEDRFTYSVIFEITKRGKIVKYDIVKSIINSKRRFTYEEVQEIIEAGKGDFYKEVIQLNNLAKTLRQKRITAGSIEFFKPEVVFELANDGSVTAITRKEIKESNMLVEEFMLLANKTIASHLYQKKKSNRKFFIYRVHDKPDQDKIEEFSRFVNSLGFTFKTNSFKNSKEIQSLISQVKDLEENAVINELAIRSMAKAVYSIKNIGHFGLGFKYYTHFTSPIRRYADLLVHRLVYSYNQNNTGIDYTLDDLRNICDHVSNCERNAVEAERRSVKIKQVDFLKNKIGEEFHAVVSGVTYYGIFIQISSILAEGLIRVRDLEGDFYIYDEKKYSLIGKHNNKSFRLGDKLFVKLVRVDVDKLELDFITVG